jgi:methyl-accepting chemotaxis protein
MTAKKRRFKRIYLINRDFQLRYTRLAVLVGLVSTMLTVVLILYPLFQFRILRFPDFLPTPFLWGIAAASVLNFGLVAWMGILITHKIAGPMFGLARHLRRVQDDGGRFEGEIKVRADDEMKYLVRHLNDLIEFLRDMTVQDLRRVDALGDRLADLRASGARAPVCDEADILVRQLQVRLGGRIEPAPGATPPPEEGETA